MNILKILESYKNSDQVAMISNDKRITYCQLWDQSNRLATYLKKQYKENKTPVIVYGHKNPLMLVAFLACAKSGRAYVPIDINVPRKRIESIIDSVDPKLILTTEDFSTYKEYSCINIAEDSCVFEPESEITSKDWIKEDEVYYIIFTSGSTGNPKGVQITYSALNHFTEWALTLGKMEKRRKCFINQAPFSFEIGRAHV